jgi:hypothetical protein
LFNPRKPKEENFCNTVILKYIFGTKKVWMQIRSPSKECRSATLLDCHIQIQACCVLNKEVIVKSSIVDQHSFD